jgi:hypothetical protein
MIRQEESWWQRLCTDRRISDPACCPRKKAETMNTYVYHAKPIPVVNLRIMITGTGI